jgi:hypothetical protein
MEPTLPVYLLGLVLCGGTLPGPPESLGVKRTEETASTAEVGCTIEGDAEVTDAKAWIRRADVVV